MHEMMVQLPGLLGHAVPYALIVVGLLVVSYLMSPPAVRRRGLRQASIKRTHARRMRRMRSQLASRPPALPSSPDGRRAILHLVR